MVNVSQARQIVFLTEDLVAKYREWCESGVIFSVPPTEPSWGGIFARFEDPDGNSLLLVGFDKVTGEVEDQRKLASEKLESERRAARELEIARQVPARLFPQKRPPAKTLSYAGACIQARYVGGDYFDFLEFGHNQLGLVLADIASKGMAAALLMANLQANLRSQTRSLAISRNSSCARSISCFTRTPPMPITPHSSLPRMTMRCGGHDMRIAAISLLSCCGATVQPKGWNLLLLCLVFSKHRVALSKNGSFVPGDALALYPDGITESANDKGEESANHA